MFFGSSWTISTFLRLQFVAPATICKGLKAPTWWYFSEHSHAHSRGVTVLLVSVYQMHPLPSDKRNPRTLVLVQVYNSNPHIRVPLTKPVVRTRLTAVNDLAINLYCDIKWWKNQEYTIRPRLLMRIINIIHVHVSTLKHK